MHLHGKVQDSTEYWQYSWADLAEFSARFLLIVARLDHMHLGSYSRLQNAIWNSYSSHVKKIIISKQVPTVYFIFWLFLIFILAPRWNVTAIETWRRIKRVKSAPPASLSWRNYFTPSILYKFYISKKYVPLCPSAVDYMWDNALYFVLCSVPTCFLWAITLDQARPGLNANLGC